VNGFRDREMFRAALAAAMGEPEAAPDVDLFVRTGGERRLSDFLLFESAYAELEFLDIAWPDVTSSDLEACIRRFWLRDRRFGALPGRRRRAVPSPAPERSSSR
jgi:undecaprenyl diphosphate synthase